MIRSQYVDGPWGQIHLSVTGDRSGPVVLLCHESPLSSQVFRPAMRDAPDWLTVIAADTPGYGNSDPAPGPATELAEYAAALLTAMDNVGVQRFVAVGVHTGAALAIEMARQASPARVPAMILSGVPLYSAAERQRHLNEWSPAMTFAPDGSQFGWAIERYRRIWGENLPPEMLHLAVTEISRCLERYHWAYNACFRYDPEPALRELADSCAVLLLNAEHDLLAEQDAWVQQLVPLARLSLLPGLVGQPHQRMPDRYMAELASFVQETWER